MSDRIVFASLDTASSYSANLLYTISEASDTIKTSTWMDHSLRHNNLIELGTFTKVFLY